MTLPFTFRGIADWASHRKTAVLVYVLLTGCTVASVLGWFVWTSWLPVWESVITSFPDEARIEKEQLYWVQSGDHILAENYFLSFELNSETETELASTADIRIVFSPNEWRVGSLFGYLPFRYPYGYIVELEPDILQPWWLSRSFFFYLGGWTLFWAGILVCWWLLAFCYAVPVFLLAYFLEKKNGILAIFRLNMLSLMPPAFFMCAAVILYALRRLNLQEFLVAGMLHVPLAWVFILLSLRHLESKRSGAAPIAEGATLPANPFGNAGSSPAKTSAKNPFGGE